MHPEPPEFRLNAAERINLGLIMAQVKALMRENISEDCEWPKVVLDRLSQWLISLEQRMTLKKILNVLKIEGEISAERDLNAEGKFLTALSKNDWPSEREGMDLEQLSKVILKQWQFPRPQHQFSEGIDIAEKHPAELLGPLQAVLATLEKSGHDLQGAVTLLAHAEDGIEADAGFRKALMQETYLLVRVKGRTPFFWSIWVSSDLDAPIHILRHTDKEPRITHKTSWRDLKKSAGDNRVETFSHEKTLGKELTDAIENHPIDLQTGITVIDGCEAVGLNAYGRTLIPPVDHETLLDWVTAKNVRPIPEVVSRQKAQKTTRLYWKEDVDKAIPPLLDEFNPASTDKTPGCLTIRQAEKPEIVAVELALYAATKGVCPRTLQRWVAEDTAIQPLPGIKACGVKFNGERYSITKLYSKTRIDQLLRMKRQSSHRDRSISASMSAPAL